MIVSVGIALALSSTSGLPNHLRQEGPRVVRKVSGRDIEVIWPKIDSRLRASRRTEVGGTAVFGGSKGQLLDAAATSDAWQEIARESDRLQKKPIEGAQPWRVKVFVITRADILNFGDHLRPRRAMLDKAEIEHLYQSLARAGQAIEAKASGKIRVSFDVEIDSAEDFEDAAPGQTPFDDSWLSAYLATRINGFDFKSDDKIYRGPWDSAWVVHSGLVDRFATAVVSGTPCSAFPYFSCGPGWSDAGLAEAMSLAWERDVVFAARNGGYQLCSEQWRPSRFSLLNSFPNAWIGAVSPSRETALPTYLARISAKPSVAGLDWSAINNDPFQTLAGLTKDDVSQIAGNEILWEKRPGSTFVYAPAFALPMQPPSNSLDGIFSPGSEASAFVRLGAKSLWFVDSRFEQVLGTAIESGKLPGAKFHGLIDIGGACCYVLTIPTPKVNITEWDLFGAPETPTIESEKPTVAPPKLFGGTTTDVICTGYFRAETPKESTRASVDIRMGFPLRQGSAILFDGYSKHQFIDAKQTPLFRLWVKATTVEPLLIRFESESPSWPSPVARIYGRWPTPEDGDPTPAGELSVAADGEWHEVAIDVRGLSTASGQMIVRRITFESDPLCALWGSDVVGASIVTVGELSCEATNAAVPKYELAPFPEPSATSVSKDARARWAATAGQNDIPTLIELLKDRFTIVRINAAASLAKCKGTTVEAALAESLNTLDPRLAQQSINALKNQGTEYGWAQINRFFNGPPAEAHRLFALEALAERKDPRSAGSLTAAYAAASWRTRLAGVKAIAAINTPDANTLLMVFLQEGNPAVRLAVVELADMSIDKVCRRILFTAVNDPSEAVRAASLTKLISAPSQSIRDEGFKGVRDDSPFVRIAVLNYIAAHPSEESRQALQIASVDTDPIVKSAALRAWAKFPGEIKKEELADAFESQDPRVVSALDALRKAKTITLS